MRPTTELDLPLQLVHSAAMPLHVQLVDQLRAAVMTGRLARGARVPASRTLAGRLGVSRSTVVAAYAVLVAEGVLDGSRGSGTYVTGALPASLNGPRRPHAGGESAREAPAVVADLRPGRPDVRRLTDPAWRRAWWQASRLSALPIAGDPNGSGALREALARHLASARGLAVDGAEIVITGGATEGILLLGLAIGAAGRTVLVEDPGYDTARSIFARLGVRTVGVPVDEHGLCVDALPSGGDVAAVYVTPSHQYPLGGVLPMGRRSALLRWAREHGALVIEDDYDGEFRYGAPPLPALASLAEGAPVAYLGTLSKTLTPGVRLGYVVAPPAVLGTLQQVREELGTTPVGTVVQDAVAAYVASGALARHIARMRRDYARKRAVVVEALAGVAPILGADAGLHVVVEVPSAALGTACVQAAAERGVLVADLSDYVVDTRQGGPGGVVIGYGAETPDRLAAGIAVVRDVLCRAITRPGSAP